MASKSEPESIEKTEREPGEDAELGDAGQREKDILLRHPNLWRADQLAELQQQTQNGTATGFDELDQLLPGMGWPRAGLMELLLSASGIGELRLLAPALETLSRAEPRWVAWVNPPFIPYAPALNDLGIDTRKILLIHPKNRQEALWALERASKSGSCSAVLAWLDYDAENHGKDSGLGKGSRLGKDSRLKDLRLKDTQRLQIAAKQGNTLTCLMRSQDAGAQSSMAELRLALQPSDRAGKLQVDILKRRGGWPIEALQLDVGAATRTQHRVDVEIQEHLQLWREYRRSFTGLAVTEPVADAQPIPVLRAAPGQTRQSQQTVLH